MDPTDIGRKEAEEFRRKQRRIAKGKICLDDGNNKKLA
jgi:hypothetical protein